MVRLITSFLAGVGLALLGLVAQMPMTLILIALSLLMFWLSALITIEQLGWKWRG